jgi:sodium transport system ATP-binding protein
MIRVENLTKQFPKVLALDHVSFEARPGEVFGLLGPNGAGKTTTIRLILSILKPTEGQIWVDGISVALSPDQARARIGAVLEGTGIYDRLTARENLLLFGGLYRVKPKLLNSRIEALFELLEMAEFADRRAETLSKGMRQKIAVARALLVDPPILVLDEPTAGLDVLTRRTILKLVRDFRARGKCILYSTHIMSEAENICDRVSILHQGRIRATGTLPELRKLTGDYGLEAVFVKLVEG